MTTPTMPRIRLRSPVDVLAAVPYLFGFHPSDSIAMLGVHDDRLIFHARGDLPAPEAPAEELDELARYLADLFVSQGATEVLLVAYGDDERATPTVRAAQRAFAERSVRVHDALRAHDGRFWSYGCRDVRCCPPEGTPYDPECTAVAAGATFAGRQVLPDREAVVRSLGPPEGEALAASRAALARAHTRLLRVSREPDGGGKAALSGGTAIDAAYRAYADGGRLDDDGVAWLSVLLTADPIRDLAWQRIDADGPTDDVHRRLWTDVVRRCDPEWVTAPALLLAYTLWREGDGLRATIAVDRALAADPGYEAAQLMSQVLAQAIPPSALDALRRQRRPTRSEPRPKPVPDRRPRPGSRPSRR